MGQWPCLIEEVKAGTGATCINSHSPRSNFSPGQCVQYKDKFCGICFKINGDNNVIIDIYVTKSNLKVKRWKEI